MLSLKIIACFAAIAASGVKVLNVESNLDQLTPGLLPGAGDGAGAVLQRPRFPHSSDYTACLRFQFARLQRVNILLRVSTNGTRPLLQLDINVEKLRVVAAYQYRYLYLERWLQTRRWYSACLMYRRANQTVAGVVDGRIVAETNVVEVTTTPATAITFGFIEPNIHPAISFIGNITQFNIWSRILSEDELSDQASCRSSALGDFVSWEEEWSVQNAIQYDLDLSDLCPKEAPLGFQIFPVMGHQEGTHVCEALGGTLTVPNSMAEVQHMYLSTQRRRKNCKLIWIGVTDEGEEGVWRKERSGTLAPDLPWAFDEPNGQLYENCGGIDFEGVIDDNCNAKRCPLCTVADNVAMVLRGSCEEHTHNMNLMMFLKNDGMVFEGYGDYRIILTNGTWIWLDAVHNTTIGQMILSRYNYPLGRQRWKLHQPVCGQQAGQVRQLLITMCQDGQYTCDDGTCIPHSKRCDMKYDCFDSSDEAECELIRLPPEYKTSVAPRPISNGTQGEGTKMLQILANISLENLRVDTSEMLLETSFNLSLTWYETRAVYVNLKTQVR
ncbi:hypothetical protein C7M84_007864 [Penaeus vannamei]|uniref:C-type lectin domain-containing protein n=1 Tax=Penaeus vannamei TaxID=6689 RepID=A0A3R7PQ80_PENVA|nr:hypothetical protein C7M84_007864 [Penaeus vannamei]